MAIRRKYAMTAPASNYSQRQKTIVFVVGPTAIGKTALAIKVAQCIKGDIISADSMQVYKGMRILSQAPTTEEKRSTRHYLVNFLEPKREYNVAEFIKDASNAIDSIIKRKKIPVVVGGSGLYIRALIDGLFSSPKANLKFREKMTQFAAKYGSRKLHFKLLKIDPGSAKLIHPNDIRRIIRALEIYDSSGKTMTELKLSTRGLKDRYNIKIFGLIKPKEDIYSHIDNRVDKMFRDRVVEEVKKLRRKRLSKTAEMVLGLNEISGYLDGKYDLEAAKDMLKMNTRRFAKCQLTWFRADHRIKWLDLNKISQMKAVRQISKEVR